MNKQSLRMSVHALLEERLRAGDIVPSTSARRMVEGIRAHQVLQHVQEVGARNEVPVSVVVEGARVHLTVHGRMDRLYPDGLIEEIKSVVEDPVHLTCAQTAHLAQAKCYGHMLCVQEGLAQVTVRVTYVQLETYAVARFTSTFCAEDLAQWFRELCAPVIAACDRQRSRQEALCTQLDALAFPLDSYRPGQREIGREIYLRIRDKSNVLIQAPTGTGKTIAAVFPALKAMGAGLVQRVFYLTARAAALEAPISALEMVSDLPLRTIALTARDKVCVQESRLCKQGLCPRAIGYYDRLEEALLAGEQMQGTIQRVDVCELAQAHLLCPFELQLDLSLLCDLILCDYNYIFDPHVRLRRYEEGGRLSHLLLIDEAHNLPQRGREMFSAALTLSLIRKARASIDKGWRKGSALYKALGALHKALKQVMQVLPQTQKELPSGLLEPAQCALEALLGGESIGDVEMMGTLRLEVLNFVQCAQAYDEDMVCLYTEQPQTIRLFCVDPARRLLDVMRKKRSAILFSATLTPLEFYKSTSGVGENAGCVYIHSPFPPQNLLVLHAPVDTRFHSRAHTLKSVCAHIIALCKSKAMGNFMVFFPSYAYLEMVVAPLRVLLAHETQILVQAQDMDDAQKSNFLAHFVPTPHKRTLGLCVLGGGFSEGIDLPGERLCGIAIVGIGLAQMSVQGDALKSKYETLYGNGFAYAYLYPALGKVMQAAGRLIRTPDDRGALVLIDARYAREDVRALLPPHWQVQRVSSADTLQMHCTAFYAQASCVSP